MRSLCPVADADLRDREMERTEARSTYLLEFDDWATLTVDEVTFDIRITAWLKRHGSHGPIEVDSIDIPEIEGMYVHIPNFPEPIPVEIGTLRRLNPLRAKRIENHVQYFLLQFGLASSDWEQEGAV